MFRKSAGPLWVFLVVVSIFVSPSLDAASESAEIIVSAQDIDEYLPDAAYNSVRDEYLVVWHDSPPAQARSIKARRYTAAGSFLAEYVIAFEDSPLRDNAQPSVAYDPVNDRYLVVWVRDVFGDGSDWDVYGRIVPWTVRSWVSGRFRSTSSPASSGTHGSPTGARSRNSWSPGGTRALEGCRATSRRSECSRVGMSFPAPLQ